MKYGIILGLKYYEPIKDFGKCPDGFTLFDSVWYENSDGHISVVERDRIIVDLHKATDKAILGKSVYRRG